MNVWPLFPNVVLCSHNLAFCFLFARVKGLVSNKAEQDTNVIVICVVFFGWQQKA